MGVVYTYDITNSESFDNLVNWKIKVEKHLNVSKFIAMMLGNKKDL